VRRQRNILRGFESRASSFGARLNQWIKIASDFGGFEGNNQEGAGGQNSPAPMPGVGRTSFLSSPANHTFKISSKADWKQDGDILEKRRSGGDFGRAHFALFSLQAVV
jgi:hypothetical protein